MLPILMYDNMEGSSNQFNNTNNFLYEDGVILNCVRNRKKNTELPNCPVCSCTIRPGELESHLALELERLSKVSSGGTKRKLSTNSSVNSTTAAPIPGSSAEVMSTEEVDVTGCPGSDVYQRIHSNRLRRLRSRSRRSPAPQQTGDCPVCNEKFPVARLQRHALRCLRRSGANLDGDHIPDTSSEDGSIDVENDEPTEGSWFGAEYQWCGQWRVRATALAERPPGTPLRRASNDTALVVDGDEDTELYGPPQYSPSRIAPQNDTGTASPEPAAAAPSEPPGPPAEPPHTEGGGADPDCGKRPNGLVEASAETRIHALKMRIIELEERQNAGGEAKCLICLGPYVSPAVSIQCWHVYCEVCWLESLRAKKICPQCNAITSAHHLRRIYM